MITAFKANEDQLKATVEDLTIRKRKADERYELLRAEAESKLSEANVRLDELKRNKEGEIARLVALCRKADMRVASLERSVEQKTRENEELHQICDDLINRVGQV